MFLAQTNSDIPVHPSNAIVSTLDGVTTALVFFMFVCLVMPSLVRNRSQYYMAMAAVIGIIVVHTLSLLFNVVLFTAVVTGVLQAVAMLLFVLCVGGLTAKELAGDMARAYEVLRRGETEKEVIIPLGDNAPVPRRARGEEPSRKVYKVDTNPKPAAKPAINPTVDEDEDNGIPLS